MSRLHDALRRVEGYEGVVVSRPQVITAGVAPTRHAPGFDQEAYANAFWRRRKLILCAALAGTLAAVGAAKRQTPYFRAHAAVELDGVNDMYLSIRDVTPEDNGTLTDSYMQTQAMVLGSDVVVRRAMKVFPQQPASEKSGIVSGLIAALKAKAGLKNAKPAYSQDSEANAITQRLTVRNVPSTRIIDVTYDDPDPAMAARFTNALVDEYIQMTVESHWNATRKTEEWLTAYLEPSRQKLETAGRTLEDYAHNSGLLGTAEDDTPAQAKLRDLQAELTRVHAIRVEKQALYETASNGPHDSIPTTINPSPLREYQSKLSDLKTERAQAAATLTPAHFRLQHLNSQIHELEQLIDQEWTKTLALIRSDYVASLRQETLLTDSVQQQLTLVAEQAGKRVHYDLLRRELSTNQQIYDSILQKAKESAVLSATRPSNTHIISYARAPESPSKPNVPIFGCLGAMSGCFLGLVWVAAKERRDRQLVSPGGLWDLGHLRELSVIPSADLDREPGEPARLLGARKHEITQLVSDRPSAFLFSESFHATAASILRAQSKGAQSRVITITSAISGDGKTTVVTNLGRALADIGYRVVLIEGDLRDPKLSKKFDVANSWGLSDVLRSSNAIEDMPLDALVKPTDKSALYVLPSGPSSASVSQLLHSPRLPVLLEYFRERVDFVLIDSPPVLAVSDARILGARSDSVILVVRAYRTPRDTFQTAVQRLSDDRIPILGTIVNDWSPRRASGSKDPFQYSYSYRQ